MPTGFELICHNRNPNAKITASSMYDANHGPSFSCLDVIAIDGHKGKLFFLLTLQLNNLKGEPCVSCALRKNRLVTYQKMVYRLTNSKIFV